ncbi:MAG TPA: dihydrolipoamide acetyltransferase family protein [Sphingobacteriaceae bacterium]|nr:dihydrolipoamide acetyltransferase family protein [Sphingobacteriaceae bacterium]
MAYEFRLPDVGEGLHEAEIVRWLVKEGDSLAEDQPMVEIQTDKAVVEIASPVAGTVAKLHAAEGDTVAVGAVLITIDLAEGASPPAAGAKSPRAEASSPAESAVPAASTPVATVPPAPPAPSGPILAAPSTRRLARELGVDLAQVKGTGPAGRITDEDVQRAAALLAGGAQRDGLAPGGAAAAAAAAPAAAPAASPPAGGEERVPLRGLRRKIAEQMVRSMQTIPHAVHMDEVDVTELVQLRDQAHALAEEQGLRLTFLPFIIKAVTAALRRYRELNASLDDEREEIVYKHYYHIGIATDTDDGLVVPVIKHADQKSIFQLAADLDRLARQARDRTIQLDDLRDSTFTITNIGPLGGVFATPIINAPEAAILAVHRIKERPVVHEGQIVARHMLNLSLAFDHRIVDGAVAARFLNQVMEYLAKPSLLFMEMV